MKAFILKTFFLIFLIIFLMILIGIAKTGEIWPLYTVACISLTWNVLDFCDWLMSSK